MNKGIQSTQGGATAGERNSSIQNAEATFAGVALTRGMLGTTQRTFRVRHRWLTWTAGAALLALVILSVVLAVIARRIEPFLRAQIVAALEQRFHTRVELDHFHVAVRHGVEAEWGIWATGGGLRIWPPQRSGGDRALELSVQSVPLIQLDEFSFHVPVRYGQTKSLRIPELRLKGLSIHIPPRSERDKRTGVDSAIAAQSALNGKKTQPGGPFTDVTIARIDCAKAELVLETDKPDKLPLSFDIQKLTIGHVHPGSEMSFEATLMHPRPRGLIHSFGSLGPLNAMDLGESPLKGEYTFQRADMSTFKGLAGTLSSNGEYQGTLRDLAVNGNAEIPDFQLTHFGNAMPLRTQFQARVDGTNGDTRLDRVDATLGRSHFTTSGQIVRVKLPAVGAKPSPAAYAKQAPFAPPTAGHLIDLNVDIPHGAIEDFLRLTTHTATPLLTGEVAAKATLHIPPGPEPVHTRMSLDGAFKLDNARFTSDKIQKRVEELSLRSLGHPSDMKGADADNVRSQMRGNFHVARGVIALPDLEYAVPGANIQLHGTYALDGALHMDGVARMQATVSQMVGGWKGFLLKPVDRLFKKDDAGAAIPIKIRGTRQSPDVGIDIGRIGHTSPEIPGAKPERPVNR